LAEEIFHADYWGGFKIIIKSEDNITREVNMPLHIVDTVELGKMSHDFITSAYQAPSVVGLDFLKTLNLSLNVNFNKDIAYLEENK